MSGKRASNWTTSLAALDAEHRAVVRTVRQGVEDLAVSLQAFHKFFRRHPIPLGRGEASALPGPLFKTTPSCAPPAAFWGSFAEMDVLTVVWRKSPSRAAERMPQGQLTRHIASRTAPAHSRPLGIARRQLVPGLPTSAQTAMWFYEQSGGPSVDGVIAINADVVAKLIDTVGPINMPDYRMTVDGETFLFETQRQVELDYDSRPMRPRRLLATWRQRFWSGLPRGKARVRCRWRAS